MAEERGRWVWQPERPPLHPNRRGQSAVIPLRCDNSSSSNYRHAQASRNHRHKGGDPSRVKIREVIKGAHLFSNKVKELSRKVGLGMLLRSLMPGIALCREPGHFFGICGKPKVCFICAVPGHHMDVCPRWNQPLPAASYYGSASLGLGFYHLKVDEKSPSQWLNLSNCGVVRVLTGQITLVELEKELADIYCRDWPFQIREPGNFLVRFPPHKKISDIKNYPSFGLRKTGVQVEVLEWIGETDPLEELQEVWIQIRSIPPRWCDWKGFDQITSGFGLMLDVDWPTIFKSFYEVVRVKLACRDPSKIPAERMFEKTL
ncbi:hypothetical protein PAHAL_6G159300 [Panicum hallii]|jgi:hypothetical protein|uniref:Uncharacterized protein n=1 Tax=Panicum hallii TaxID=206008 RepID=A0A2S3I1I6_9POAL|nr:uncharacterized protein LOC112896951 isoform X2 [Panicum hallii]XP_025820870.1 uncharacterized protein LOC112896951 isoform X2 [Panicum hallii]XP_025820871.1 uncharacterized protein LOC112896951 isoform X2 [Panicum hallii]PAN34492.1 hypothetical protein PAHAL_6G159300 [Panicum hallii]